MLGPEELLTAKLELGALVLGPEELLTAKLELEACMLELRTLLFNANEPELEAALEITLLEPETALEEDDLLLDTTMFELEGELATALEDDLLLDATMLELEGKLDIALLELETALEEDDLVLDPTVLELKGDVLELEGLDEVLELAFVDDTELLGALEELEDLDPCLMAKALRGTLEVAVTTFVEFFKLQ